jgi:hypothetical protein
VRDLGYKVSGVILECRDDQNHHLPDALVHYPDAKNVSTALLRPLLGQLLVEIVQNFIDKELTREYFFFW